MWSTRRVIPLTFCFPGLSDFPALSFPHEEPSLPCQQSHPMVRSSVIPVYLPKLDLHINVLLFSLPPLDWETGHAHGKSTNYSKWLKPDRKHHMLCDSAVRDIQTRRCFLTRTWRFLHVSASKRLASPNSHLFLTSCFIRQITVQRADITFWFKKKNLPGCLQASMRSVEFSLSSTTTDLEKY